MLQDAFFLKLIFASCAFETDAMSNMKAIDNNALIAFIQLIFIRLKML